MTKVLLRAAAWACLAFIVFVSLGPIGSRPISPTGVEPERFLAFALLGLLFGIAYPKRLPLIALFLVAAAVSLELGQNLVPGRHGRLLDGLVKVAGALSGVGISVAVVKIAPRMSRARPK